MLEDETESRGDLNQETYRRDPIAYVSYRLSTTLTQPTAELRQEEEKIWKNLQMDETTEPPSRTGVSARELEHRSSSS
jgi:hypothetical protein